jgi:hypothetical protein
MKPSIHPSRGSCRNGKGHIAHKQWDNKEAGWHGVAKGCLSD